MSGPEFLGWLTDPVKNGAGALFDFGCYGANLMTWLMDDQRPIAVTAITQQYKPQTYPRVDDEANILVEYPRAVGIIEGSWNWPYGRKDLEVYAERAAAIATGGNSLRVRLGDKPEETRTLQPLGVDDRDSISYLISVVRGKRPGYGAIVSGEQHDCDGDPDRGARVGADGPEGLACGAVNCCENSPEMEYVRLGSTGLQVSRICLGTMTYGSKKWREWVLEEEAGRPFIKRALELGINFFDTADMYSVGVSEEILGRAIKDFAPSRETVVIATKVFNAMGDHPNQRGLSRKHIMHAIDDSLRRLGMDYVDLYQIHRYDYETPIEETIAALDDVVRAGKALYVGASSMYAWQFAKMLYTADQMGAARFVSMQNHYNLVYREEEREMIPLCAEEGIARDSVESAGARVPGGESHAEGLWRNGPRAHR